MRITVACLRFGVPLLLPLGAAIGETQRPPVLADYCTWYGPAHGTCGSLEHWGEAAAELRSPPAIRDVSSSASPPAGRSDSMAPEAIELLRARLGGAQGVDR